MVFRPVNAAAIVMFAATAAAAQPVTPPEAVQKPVTSAAPVAAPDLAKVPPAADPSLDTMTPLPGLGVDWPATSAPVTGLAPIDPAAAAAHAASPASAMPSPAAASAPVAAAPSPAAAGTPAGDAAADPELAGTRYTLEVSGLGPLDLDVRFRAISELYKARKATANLAQLNRRITEDSELIDELLRSRGYYGGTTAARITPPATAGQPATVTLTVVPGPLYRFSTVALHAPPATPPGLIAPLIGVAPGDAVAAEPVQAAQDALKAKLAEKGYAFPVVAAPEIVIDHATHTATLTQAIDPGPRGRFGVIRANKKSVLTAKQLQRLARFRPGDIYDSGKVDDLRRAMIATGLFGAVNIAPVKASTEASGDAVVDLRIRTESAPLRTVAATGGYSTSQGVRVEASWQHRNLLPPGGAVTFSIVAAQREQAAGAVLRRQNWRARDLTLNVRAQFSKQELSAFRAQTITLGTSIDRETNLIWQKRWYYSAGAELVLSRETDRSSPGEPTRVYYVGALPLSLTYDGTGNLLDPTSGFRITARASPELSVEGASFGYVRSQLEASIYEGIGGRVTLAARGHIGSIIGASHGNIAPTRRFYAGGGGSLRGYGYQQVGPQDAQNNPSGGDSIVEGSFETRVRFGNFGIVPFVDAGQVYTSTIPGFDDIRIGAGLGARYYTSFGPVRIDIATPVNGRRSDAKVQFYVSIGQAF